MQKSTTQSIAYYQRAVELDPEFAAAYRGLANSYASLAELGRASEYQGKAFEFRSHSSEREKLAIAADYYRFVTGELDKSAQTYQEWIENYPRDDAAYSALGIAYASLAQYDKATEAHRENLRLAPDVGAPYMNLGNCLLALQRFDELSRSLHPAALQAAGVGGRNQQGADGTGARRRLSGRLFCDGARDRRRRARPRPRPCGGETPESGAG
jgi:tetratricopeptide (TPR) repeat protein